MRNGIRELSKPYDPYVKKNEVLVIERRCAEQLFTLLGCTNTDTWSDENVVMRLKKIGVFYDARTDVGDFRSMLDAIIVTDPERILLRYNSKFVDCVSKQNKLEVLKEKRVEGKLYEKRSRKERFSFVKCGIPIGGTLVLKRDPSVTCVVRGDTFKVDFGDGGKEISLSERTRKLINSKEGVYVSPMYYWMYEGKLLVDYYRELHKLPPLPRRNKREASEESEVNN